MRVATPATSFKFLSRLATDVEVIPWSGCWVWTGPATPKGYGRIANEYTHRISYEVSKGPIPPGMHVCHHCDVPSCCNPDHLFAGTPADNMQDCSRKGRVRNGGTEGTKNGRAKLSEDQVRSILADTRRHVEIASHFGVTPNLIGMIKSKKIWRHLNLASR